MNRSRLTLILSLIVASTSVFALIADRGVTPELTHDEAFWKHWNDGNAELSGYDLTFPRYGAPRKGSAIAIFVKEPFSNQRRVKANEQKKGDTFDVMKMNLVHDFSTGVYDYNLMTSSFAALAPFGNQRSGEIAKVSFSAQEWCGHTWAQLIFRPDRVEETVHSYFDGEETAARRLPIKETALSEDALLSWARGMVLPVVEPGHSASAEILGSALRSRLLHKNVDWKNATFARAKETTTTKVPAGTFPTRRATVEIANGLKWEFDVEANFPHRVIAWQSSDGERAELIASARLPYWKMNGPGFERELSKFGLTPRGQRMP